MKMARKKTACYEKKLHYFFLNNTFSYMFFYFKWFVVNISETTVYFAVLYKIVAVAGKGALVYCKLSSVISK